MLLKWLKGFFAFTKIDEPDYFVECKVNGLSSYVTFSTAALYGLEYTKLNKRFTHVDGKSIAGFLEIGPGVVEITFFFIVKSGDEEALGYAVSQLPKVIHSKLIDQGQFVKTWVGTNPLTGRSNIAV